MPSTAPIPYPAQDFSPGQRASAQDATNLSAGIARVDGQLYNAAITVQRADTSRTGETGQSLAAGGSSVALTFDTVKSDPLGMRINTTTVRVPIPGIWNLSAYYATTSRTTGSLNSSEVGGWFHITGSQTADWGAQRVSSNADNTGLWCTMNVPLLLSAGDNVTVQAINYDPTATHTAYVYRAVFSMSLVAATTQ